MSNKEVLSHIPRTGKTIADFIPGGYESMWTENGDLNNDGMQDAVLVLNDKREGWREFGDSNRLIVVLIKTTNGFRLAAKSGKIVLCKNCGGMLADAFTEVAIENGDIIVQHDGGTGNHKWSATRKFRYIAGEFFLVGTIDTYYDWTELCEKLDHPSYSTTEINLLNGARVIEKLNQQCEKKTRRDKIKINPLIKMDRYKIDF